MEKNAGRQGKTEKWADRQTEHKICLTQKCENFTQIMFVK